MPWSLRHCYRVPAVRAKACERGSECGANASGERTTTTKQQRTTCSRRENFEKTESRSGKGEAGRAFRSGTNEARIRHTTSPSSSGELGRLECSRNGARRLGAVQQVVFANVPTKVVPSCAPDGEHGASGGASNRRRGHPRASRLGIHRKVNVKRRKSDAGGGALGTLFLHATAAF